MLLFQRKRSVNPTLRILHSSSTKWIRKVRSNTERQEELVQRWSVWFSSALVMNGWLTKKVLRWGVPRTEKEKRLGRKVLWITLCPMIKVDHSIETWSLQGLYPRRTPVFLTINPPVVVGGGNCGSQETTSQGNLWLLLEIKFWGREPIFLLPFGSKI